MNIAFNILNGEYKVFTNVEPDDERASLGPGSTVEILHSSRQWEGIYEVFSSSKNGDMLTYNLILTKVKLQHTTDGHYKQWAGEVKGTNAEASCICSWGKINMGQQSTTKMFNTKKEASTFLREKMDEKLKKGYRLK